MASRKIPPHVARELKRHVVSQKTSNNSGNHGFKMAYALLGCSSVVGIAAAFPYIATHWIGNLNSREQALTAAQTRRGAFNNSGTRDVGKDPRWDFASGTYQRDAELDRMIQQQDNQKVQHDEEELVRKYHRRR